MKTVIIVAIAAGLFLRFAFLDYKPLWLDEVLTAWYSQGRSYEDIPLDVLFPLNQLQQIFTLNQPTSCGQIVHTLATQSTHPPVFFCLMHWWLKSPHWPIFLKADSGLTLAWQMRSLSVLFGIGAIAAIYWLNRIAFSPAAGLTAAAVMAVSPFGVYLSQEARHYTLPVLLITLALLALILIQQDLSQKQRLRPFIWLGWVAINTLGFYVHYFFILAYLAQLATFISFYRNRLFARHILFLSSIYSLLPIVFFLPWLATLLNHWGRSETSWIPHPENIAPLYQTVAAWLTMAIALPVESQPIWITILAGALMILFGIWLGWHVFRELKKLWHHPETKLSTQTLVHFTFWVLLQFFAIVYLLGKDLSVAPRYHFIYYPAACALVGVGIWKIEERRQNAKGKFSASKSAVSVLTSFFNPTQHSLLYTFLFIGIFSCFLVTVDLAYKKPFLPQQVAQNMSAETSAPLVVAIAYKNSQDVALGTSFLLELYRRHAEEIPEASAIFLKRSPDYEPVWKNLSRLLPLREAELSRRESLPLNLWVVAPELLRSQYPPNLPLSTQFSHSIQQHPSCKIDPTHYYRIGVPYQLYRCSDSHPS